MLVLGGKELYSSVCLVFDNLFILLEIVFILSVFYSTGMISRLSAMRSPQYRNFILYGLNALDVTSARPIVAAKVAFDANRTFSSSHDSPPPPPNKPSKNLPQLPVPDLKTALEELKSTAGPHAVNPEEFTEFCSIVDEFASKTGPKLHSLLQAKANATSNWLSHDWWVDKAYLEGRDPLIIWSNPGLTFPKIDVPSGRESVVKYAAQLIMGVLDFRQFLAKGGDPEPKTSATQCMNQFEKMFGTTRIPGEPKDSIIYGSLKSDDLSVVVSHKGQFFQITLGKHSNALDSYTFLTQAIYSILYTDETRSGLGPGVGVLTASPRDKWASVYTKLSRPALDAINEAQFVVSLDSVTNSEDFDKDWPNCMGRQVLHGDPVNVGNRWFDKMIQLIVVLNESSDRVIGSGCCYEHTPAEAGVVVKLVDHTSRYLINESANSYWPRVSSNWSPPSSLYTMKELPLVTSDISPELKEAIDYHTKFTQSLDLKVVDFNDYGKNFIKKVKVSPDSYIQVAINWSYYRLHKQIGACYETASTRKFAFGRTECIRSVTPGFYDFVLNPSLPSLRQAIADHKSTVNRAMDGQGIDRLLLGMAVAANEVKEGNWKFGTSVSLDQGDLDSIERMYKNALFNRSKYFKLSTSQVATSFRDSFMVYGPLVTDGYGCCYNPQPDNIIFGVSSFNSHLASAPEMDEASISGTNSDNYKNSLKETLLLMKDLFVSGSSKL